MQLPLATFKVQKPSSRGLAALYCFSFGSNPHETYSLPVDAFLKIESAQPKTQSLLTGFLTTNYQQSVSNSCFSAKHCYPTYEKTRVLESARKLLIYIVARLLTSYSLVNSQWRMESKNSLKTALFVAC
jgi:hypothetical protein